jgi:REP element-mobilizing transposase RayT
VINSLKYLVDEGEIVIYGYVIMDNHIHIIWHAIGNKANEQLQRSLLKFTADEITPKPSLSQRTRRPTECIVNNNHNPK